MDRPRPASVLRTGAVGFGTGAVLALGLFANLPLVRPVSIPAITAPVATGTGEQWNVRDEDVLAVTTGPQGQDAAQPSGIGPLTDARLAAAEAATMKLRDRDGVVIGVASRLVAPQGDSRGALWTFVLGPRGTLAAELTLADVDGPGRLIGGTEEFEAVRGRLTERPRPEPGLRWRLDLVREP